MATVEPQIRAVQLQHSLRAAERLAGPREAELIAAIPRPILRGIREAGWRDWIPLAWDVELCTIVEEVLGSGADRERARRALGASMESPLLRPFVTGVQVLFDLEPAALIRQVPRGWHALFRNAGVPRYEVEGASRRAICCTEVPGLMFDPLYIQSVVGALSSIYDLCGTEGEVVAEDVDAEAGEFSFRFRW